MDVHRKSTIWPLWPWPLTLTSDFLKTCNLAWDYKMVLISCWYVENSLCESVSNLSTDKQTNTWKVTQRVILAFLILFTDICSDLCSDWFLFTDLTWLKGPRPTCDLIFCVYTSGPHPTSPNLARPCRTLQDLDRRRRTLQVSTEISLHGNMSPGK